MCLDLEYHKEKIDELLLTSNGIEVAFNRYFIPYDKAVRIDMIHLHNYLVDMVQTHARFYKLKANTLPDED